VGDAKKPNIFKTVRQCWLIPTFGECSLLSPSPAPGSAVFANCVCGDEEFKNLYPFAKKAGPR
jgi:hypothetical protein